MSCKPILLFPSSYFDKTKVDEDLEKEFQAAVETDLFEVMLFGYEDWFENRKLSLKHVPSAGNQVLYRGWMMKPDVYEQFFVALKQKGFNLITKPSNYEKLHCFPNVYPEIEEWTPRMLVYPIGTSIDIDEVKKQFPRFLVKDYVKSVKGSSFPKYFDQSIDQETFDRLMIDFYDFRGDLFTGGICFKEFIEWKQYNSKNNEYRVFIANGKIMTISENSGQSKLCPKPPMEFLENFTNLGSPFYTVDVAELPDGSWVVIETGDGGVSGLSDNQNYFEFHRKLGIIFTE
mgnify:FL=1